MDKAPEPTNKKLSREAWCAHYEAWKLSGESQSAYCKRNGLKQSAFYYWHRQFISSSRQTKSTFETLEIKASTQVLPGIRMHLPNGIHLSIAAPSDLSLLRSVLALLGIVSC